ncbi:hypothetical protein SAMN04515695_4571 [Pseudovibrio sp. Tun.PSC04-5.I4]|nr:hypothetical protein SAMN04515695_4571 [Pseudovibrio sp. Tun.PSC04-5.I4]
MCYCRTFMMQCFDPHDLYRISLGGIMTKIEKVTARPLL